MLNAVKGKLRALHQRILVTDLERGEQKTESGIVILDDDAKTHGVHPRWAKVYAKGPENKDEYQIGDWVFIEHGRWTRGILCEDDEGVQTTVFMVDDTGVIGWSKEKPNDIHIGQEFSNGDSTTIRPEDFMR